MNRRLQLCALVAPLVLLCAAGHAQPAPAPALAWPQAVSDLPADPAVRFGVLPNGMRYAVMHNDTPEHETSLRLRIGSGSLEESDEEQGLAHVLEHMAFKGSTHVPANEMVKILQRRGLAFGPDTNAQTGWTETVYELDLPSSGPEDLATGLMLMRETASELTLDPEALATERGVVLSEERLRDTPDYRAEKDQIDLFLHGQLAARRFPIGQVKIIETAPASLIRSFYEANYRPDNATVIAVGDFDPDAMVAAIKARFSGWAAKGPAAPAPDLGVVEPRGVTTRVVNLPGASTKSVIAWARPYDASLDTSAKERREVIENLGLAVLNRRLEKLAQGAHPPFLSAGAGFQNLFHSDKIAVIEATSSPSAWRPALDAAELAVRRLVAEGVGPGELAREVTEMRTAFESAAAGAATRPSPVLASAMVEAVDNGDVITTPAEDLSLFESAVKGLTVAEVDAALKSVFAGAGPLVELATPDAIPGADGALAAEFAKASTAPLSSASDQAAIIWPYTDFGPAGRVADQHQVSDLGLTTVRFANNVALTVKSTPFRADQVLVSVRVGRGRLDLPTDRPSPTWTVGAFTPGGFGKLSFEDAETALAGKAHSVALNIGDDAFDFTGATRTGDLATELQVITAYIADPGYRPEAFERVRASLIAELPQIEATPEGVLGREAGSLLSDHDPRFAFPTREALLAASPADLPALLSGPLKTGAIEVTIVGDISVDEAISLTARTLGALPPRPALSSPKAGDGRPVRFPGPNAAPLVLNDTGRPDQAMAVAAWPMPDFFADMRASRADMLAGEVLGNRLLDKVRIAQGASYSPEARVDLSQTFPGYGYAFALVEIPPAKIPGFFASVESLTADMRDHGISADELTRARAPRIAGLRKAQTTNEYWVTDLAGSLADPRRLDLIRSTFPDYEAVTTGDIQAAAKRWLVDTSAFKVVVEAKGS